ncbi:membrane protein (pseudogene) [Streptococcus pneumoniae]|nr:membrane protein (pseudogene) [Streptococcus pneumoniae]
MKILKRYILELCFILSFALPFIKGANADNGRCFVETYYGFTFLMEHAIVTAVFIYSFLIAFLLKKRWAKWIAAGSYCFLVLWIATEGYFFRMSLEDLIRLWTSLEILTQTYQLGFCLNILLGILLIIKYFKVKQ